jgi:hypothetical protein
MQTAGAQELGYVNTALIQALMKMLVERGVLTWGDMRIVADEALEAMKPQQNLIPIAGAIRYIEKAMS